MLPILRKSAALLSLTALALWPAFVRADEPARALPPPAVDAAPSGEGLQTAVLSGGCFWGMQGVFEHVKGVREVIAGYAGGARETAHYDAVSEGNSGHAESVRITFDPRQVSYGTLLRIFFSVAHDPTELNRQGPDSGTNYRSDIFYTTPEQEKAARSYIAQLDRAKVFASPIVTRVDRLSGFYPAESYHQDYLIHNPDSLYIIVNDLPKIANLKRVYPSLYRDAAVTVSSSGRS